MKKSKEMKERRMEGIKEDSTRKDGRNEETTKGMKEIRNEEKIEGMKERLMEGIKEGWIEGWKK